MNNGLWTQPDPCAPIMGICIGGSDDLEICTFANLSTCETEICGGGICAIGSQFEGNVCKDLNDCGLNGICEKNPEFWQITYGPDPANPGECINDLDATDGIGRYPALHAEYKGYHSYGTTLTNELWDEYRYSYCSNGVQDFDEEEIDCGGQCERDVDGD